MATSWGYKTDNGPANWHKWYPVASEGTRQSPIDIKTLDVDGASEEDPSLVATYEPTADLTIENTGASWMIKCGSVTSSLKGGPLDAKDEYKVLQMHAHWGSVDGQGSEHTVDGVSYSAELHIVHYNTKYKTPENAVDKPDGLAVLGVFLKIGDAHPEFEKVSEVLEDIKVKGESSTLKRAVDPDQLLPENRSYFTYLGSLTTPPLYESVTWIVFEQPIEISKEQVKRMRSLHMFTGSNSEKIVENFRPPCKMGMRKVVRHHMKSSRKTEDETACPRDATKTVLNVDSTINENKPFHFNEYIFPFVGGLLAVVVPTLFLYSRQRS